MALDAREYSGVLIRGGLAYAIYTYGGIDIREVWDKYVTIMGDESGECMLIDGAVRVLVVGEEPAPDTIADDTGTDYY